MDTLRTLADHRIRRILGGLALGIVLVMAGLAAEPALSLQSGALLTAAVWLGLWATAMRVPRQDLRGSALWRPLWRQLSVLAGDGSGTARGAHRRLSAILAERLQWHADRAAMAALGLGLGALAMHAARLLRG
ncbi:hypothetical protein [Pseudoroseomonas cervicalis]|uniref:hypothetical protein n=1 Tax=Teichococcus cervicalis TaxID=204525 RepID=UPI00278B6A54|nr:hypothetical protein [Pseudoroseomonas cervicalis]MDQ1080871.1 hypothetical protein [Pseudoroseomonas cervicalis]